MSYEGKAKVKKPEMFELYQQKIFENQQLLLYPHCACTGGYKQINTPV